MRDERSASTEHDTIELAEIMSLYLAWFGIGTGERPRDEKTEKDLINDVGNSRPQILQIEDRTRKLLSGILSPDVPISFALSVIESVAYTTSKFAAADRINGPLYRATALRILANGLSLISDADF